MNIKDNSKKIEKGDVFIALGKGINYIEEAISKGASKVITDLNIENTKIKRVINPRKYLIKYLKKNYYNNISDLNLIGITGTNGKTTTAYLIYQALNLLGEKCAYIGTIGFFMDKKICDLNNTTPDMIEMYEMLLKCKEQGYTNIVIEVSSHALSQERVKALRFNYVMFTNLTEDHLNYHKTMNKYFKAKKKLLKQLNKNAKIFINNDDKYLKKIRGKTIKIGNKGHYKINSYKMRDKTTFSLNNKEYTTNLKGLYNIYNLSFCIALLDNMGFNNLNKIIKKLKSPMGRMDIIKYKTNRIIIDYAHTKDAIEKLVTSVKEYNVNNLYIIIGCSGNKDKQKRISIGNIVTNLANHVIFTSDNPGLEDPNKIIDDMVYTLHKSNYQIIINREDAIKKGIQLLDNNDILLVLGKGHEKYQIIKNQKILFNDKEIVKANIRR